MNPETLRALCTDGVTMAPSQVLGGIRLVPLLRDDVQEDIRLGVEGYDEDATHVHLGGRPGGKTTWLTSYVPYGLVVDWALQGEAIVAARTGLGKRNGHRPFAFSTQVTHRLVKRTGRRSLRMLPLATALDGFLGLHFRGPNMRWEEYSTRAFTHGLDPSSETTYSNATLLGLEEALRTFEIHPNQCGMMLFAGEALASVTLLGHPDDYARMHESLLLDCFGDLLLHYGAQYVHANSLSPLDAPPKVESLDELADYARSLRQERADIFQAMGLGIFDREIEGELMYSMGDFRLERFVTDLALGEENHIGECIRRKDGRITYLKTFRLSAAQGRKGHLLRSLYKNDWNIDQTAEALGTTWKGVMQRIVRAGYSYLLHPAQLDRLRLM